jgi:dolichyl-phosphate beta-glucosyltransferase
MADVFLVIPAFREIRRLPLFLRGLVTLLSNASWTTEILVVDDGSPRSEQEELPASLALGAFGNCSVLGPLFLPVNQGKGQAIIEGWRRMEGAKWLGFVDADGGTPPDEVLRLTRIAMQNSAEPQPCLWASRVRMLGRKTNRSQGRYLLGRVFAHLAGAMTGLPVYDSQCGFKLIPTVHYRKVAALLQEKRFCFDIELLLALEHVGAPVLEIPIDWRDVPGGHLHAWRDGFAMLRRLPAIRARAAAWPRPD